MTKEKATEEKTETSELYWFSEEVPCPKTEYQKPRAKNWTLVLYPEDVPADWKRYIRELQYPVAISPLHDKDVNPDGEKKKPHYHLIIRGGGGWITYKRLQQLGRDLKGIAIPSVLSNVEGMIRYFIHADNPEKYQYNREDIETIGLFEIEKAFRNTETQKLEITRNIMEFIRENDILEFSDLIDIVIDNSLDDWFDHLNHYAWTIERYISSRRNKNFQAKRQRQIDEATAESIYEMDYEKLKEIFWRRHFDEGHNDLKSDNDEG